MLKLLFFITFLFSCYLYAARNATVVADRAVVYADPELTSPIGFLKRGRVIRIGDLYKNKGLVAVFDLNGRLAYIDKDDITTDMYSKEIPNPDDLERFKDIAWNTKYKNGLELALTSSIYQVRSSESSYDANQTPKGFSILGYKAHRPENHFKLRFDYLQGDIDIFDTKEVVFALLWGSNLMRIKRFKIDYDLGVRMIPWIYFDGGTFDDGFDRYNQKGTGRGAGGEVSAVFKYQLKSNFYAVLRTGFIYDKIFKVNFDGLTKDASFTRMGPQASIGLGLLF